MEITAERIRYLRLAMLSSGTAAAVHSQQSLSAASAASDAASAASDNDDNGDDVDDADDPASVVEHDMSEGSDA